MFESTAHFDFDDDIILDTSFTPPIKNTPETPELKRANEGVYNETCKKFKVSEDDGIALNRNLKNTNVFASPNKVLKRKFPGPAGLLPEKGTSDKSILQLLQNTNLDNDKDEDITILSQQTNSVFENGPWKEMTRDLLSENGVNLTEKFNISWIKKQAFNHLVNYKAPFLAALIENIRIADGKIPIVNVTLKDSTGNIRGTVLHTVYEQYTSYFRIGTVLVLKYFGVLSSSYNSHCLTITSNNLIAIYCPGPPPHLPNSTESNLTQSSNADPVRKIIIQEYSADAILKRYNEDVVAHSQEKEREQNLGKLISCISGEPGASTTFMPVNTMQVGHRQACSIGSRILVGGKVPVFQQTDDGARPSTSRMSSASNVHDNAIPSTSTATVEQHFSPEKKKFNFKQFSGASKRVVNEKIGDKDLTICDSVMEQSGKLSVKSDSKEHAELWKNLLEDVDTDSLFDDF